MTFKYTFTILMHGGLKGISFLQITLTLCLITLHALCPKFIKKYTVAFSFGTYYLLAMFRIQ